MHIPAPQRATFRLSGRPMIGPDSGPTLVLRYIFWLATLGLGLNPTGMTIRSTLWPSHSALIALTIRSLASSNWETFLADFLIFSTEPDQQPQTRLNAFNPGYSRVTWTRDESQSNEANANRCFPYSHQHGLRLGLIALLQQSWLLLHQPEPAGAFQFLLLDAENGKRQCLICLKLYRRGGRASEHIRTHLAHKPFVCFGGHLGCSRPTCGKLFHGKESLKDHQRRDQIQCDKCHLIILRKNHGRHQRKGCPRA